MHTLSKRGLLRSSRFSIREPAALIVADFEKSVNDITIANNEMEEKQMRKYKQVKEKKVTYDLDEWEEVERRARKMKMKTGTYIKRISVDGKFEYCDLGDLAPLVKEVNAIGVNVNQIAHKANELNSIYAGDFEKMKELMEGLCRILSSFASTRQWSRV